MTDLNEHEIEAIDGGWFDTCAMLLNYGGPIPDYMLNICHVPSTDDLNGG
jgi:hypothetical protein